MKIIIRFLLVPFSLLLTLPLFAQTANPFFKIQQERKLWHDNIDKEQVRLLALDGKADGIIQASKDENVNLGIADVMIRQVDLLQEKIETDSTLSGQMKIKNLRSLETMIKGYNNHFKRKDFVLRLAGHELSLVLPWEVSSGRKTPRKCLVRQVGDTQQFA